MYELYNKYQKTQYSLKLPFRWYLYGAVVDDFEVHDYISFDHLDDELRTNVNWIGGKPPKMSGEDSAAYSEYIGTADEFAYKYPLNDPARWEMLRNHYAYAPEEFQRHFLEWEIFSRQLRQGYLSERTGQALGLLEDMIRTFPVDMEPRLTPAFFRLSNIVRLRLKKRELNETSELSECRALMWEFWIVFGNFISLKHNSGLSDKRLRMYRDHAETDLSAYKRKLQRLLDEFWQDAEPTKYDKEMLSELRSSVLRAVLEDLSEE